jgi:hypothetical protein
MLLRRVEAQVQIDGEERLMVFITDNLSGSPRSVCDLDRRRWDGPSPCTEHRINSVNLIGQRPPEKENSARKNCNCLPSNFAAVALKKLIQNRGSLRLRDGCVGGNKVSECC